MSTPEDKAAARAAERERRQARIKASGSSRLAKITGTAGTQDFKEPVREPMREASAPPVSRPVVQADDTADPDVPTGDQLLKFLNQTSGSDQNDDPLRALLANAPPQQQSPASQAQSFADAQSRSRQRSRNDFVWDALHVVSSVAIGLYAALVNPWNLTLVFVTLEAVLIASKAVLGHHSGLSSVPMIAPFIGMLPKARQRQLSFAGNLFHVARDAYHDFAMIIFIYGLFGLGGRDYQRLV